VIKVIITDAVKEIIIKAGLRNPHITDGGALIIDPLQNKIIEKNIFTKDLVSELVKEFVNHNIYTEVYGAEDYYLQKNHVGEFTEKRIRILQKTQIAVESLEKHVDKVEVIKIINFAHNENDKKQIESILQPFTEKIHYIWSHHPATLPSQNTVITIKGVSKKAASLKVLEYLKISAGEALGIGDTLGDWNFMSICKYAGVVGDASEELKEFAKTKREGNYFFGSSVDDDGFLQILNHYDLIS
jgi:hydroxymethylpyrimidine pyrophosphatase-like HAD family hydrolase